ncbi:uncharacterized protein LOC115752594 isoform X1 [Rhodamnia argentea]|uniref:Uncharacterized protein LOC115752594 isoform X1 n=1 Tax=Rhodamnia argentea TaxID=178133 RepID=A0A8B8QKD7_9MYRT|nr:uncharacterized protein LOC115752594 isoform X1 [Rhodamnia argentea]
MLCLRSIPLFSRCILLLLPALFLCFSSVSSHSSFRFRPLSDLRVPDDGGYEKGSVWVAPLEARRHLADDTTANSSLILAAQRTRRRDPTNDFKRYTGGWNISNSHYWASVGFTAAPFFVIAAAWFVIFGLCLSFICLCYCCCRREPYGYSRACYALSLIFLILFTIAALVGCIILYTGQGKFHGSTSDTLNYVVYQADTTSENLRNVSDYLATAKQIGVDSTFLPASVQNNIDAVQGKINSSAATLSAKTTKNSKDIQDGLDSMRLSLIVLAAVMLFLAFLGFLFSVLGLQCLVYFLVILGWILVTGTFILCGVFLLLHNVVADTCVAMDEWVQNPTAHTALDDIIPCVDNATAQETLLRTKDVTYQLANVVDMVITNVSNRNYPPGAGPLYINQSGPLVPTLCNPYHADLTNRQCASGEVDFMNASRVWKNYTCQVSSSGICTTPGRLTPSFYNQMVNAVNVSYGLYHYGPFLVGLQDCTFVRDTFTAISGNHCPGLRRYSQWIYIGLVLVSAAVMLSLIFWVIYARERRHRVYTKQFMARSLEDQDKAR